MKKENFNNPSRQRENPAASTHHCPGKRPFRDSDLSLRIYSGVKLDRVLRWWYGTACTAIGAKMGECIVWSHRGGVGIMKPYWGTCVV